MFPKYKVTKETYHIFPPKKRVQVWLHHMAERLLLQVLTSPPDYPPRSSPVCPGRQSSTQHYESQLFEGFLLVDYTASYNIYLGIPLGSTKGYRAFIDVSLVRLTVSRINKHIGWMFPLFFSFTRPLCNQRNLCFCSSFSVISSANPLADTLARVIQSLIRSGHRLI